VARTSGRQKRRILNRVVVVAIACLAIGAYVSFRMGAVADGLEALGSALILLGICFMFTWPIKCRVATTKDLPCKEDAYSCWAVDIIGWTS
jgi:hypothetical protein